MKKLIGATATAAFVLLAWVPRAEASAITVEGGTLGCFTAGCSNFSLNPYSGSEYGMWFTGVGTFSVVTTTGGSAGPFEVGTFSRDTDNLSTTSLDLDFALQVTFTLPVGVGGSPSTFTTVIVGKNSGGGGPVTVDFDNSFQTFNYVTPGVGFGSFEFALINDPIVHKNTLDNPVTLSGQIRNATFFPQVDINPTATAPEPGSLVLLATGLTALGLRLRKSARKS